jgi:hypothetical protein
MNNIEKLEHTLNVFAKRILPAFFFNQNPELFLKWQGNICKQSALLSVFIIKHYLGDDYTVQAWEGFFEHEKLGSYNHCWNYLVHKSDPELNIICDFTSTISYMDYCKENDPTLHIGGTGSAVVKHKIDMIGMQELNIEENLAQPEYFTSRSGEDLIEELKDFLRFAKLWEDKPNDDEGYILHSELQE